MPKIREYNVAEQTQQRGFIEGRRATPEDFNDSTGLMQLSRALGDVADMVTKREEQDEIGTINAQQAKRRADLTVQLETRARASAPGDTTFAEKFMEDVENSGVEARNGLVRSRAGELAFDRLEADMSAHLAQSAGIFQAGSVGRKASGDYVALIGANQKTILSDPTQFQELLKQMQDALDDPNGIYAGMPADKREELARVAKEKLSEAAIKGLTLSFNAPELAEQQIKSGRWDEYLNADRKDELLKEAQVGVRLKESTTERARLEAERARKDAQEETANNFLARIVQPTEDNGGPLRDGDILADTTLTPAQKQHFVDYRLRRAHELAAGAEARTNPATVRALMLEIHADADDPRKTYNADSVMASYRAGKISTAEMRMLRTEVEQLRDGSTNSFQRDVQSARSAVYRAITANPIMAAQPDVAADIAYRFGRDLDLAIERKRNAQPSEDPRGLLNPASKDYFLSRERLSSYMRSPSATVADEAGRVIRAEPRQAVSGKIGAPLPTYRDYDALKPGDEYTDPQGNVRRKK